MCKHLVRFHREEDIERASREGWMEVAGEEVEEEEGWMETAGEEEEKIEAMEDEREDIAVEEEDQETVPPVGKCNYHD